MGVLMEYLKKKLGSAHADPSAARVDAGLPLGIKIGSLVSIDPAPLTIAAQAGLVVTGFDGKQAVAAWGKINFSGLIIHRFYFEDGEHMLQFIADTSGKLTEDPMLYMLYQEIFPSSKNEWSNWLANPDKKGDTGFIGFESFNLFDLKKKSKKPVAVYAREWPPGSKAQQVQPEELLERLYTAPTQPATPVRQQAMLYGRSVEKPKGFPDGIDAPNEFVWLSASEYPSGAVVQMYVGTPVPQEAISVVMS